MPGDRGPRRLLLSVPFWSLKLVEVVGEWAKRS